MAAPRCVLPYVVIFTPAIKQLPGDFKVGLFHNQPGLTSTCKAAKCLAETSEVVLSDMYLLEFPTCCGIVCIPDLFGKVIKVVDER